MYDQTANTDHNYLPTYLPTSYIIMFYTFADLTYLRQLQKSQLLRPTQNRVGVDIGYSIRTAATTTPERASRVSYTVLRDSINGISAAANNNIHSFVLNYFLLFDEYKIIAAIVIYAYYIII